MDFKVSDLLARRTAKVRMHVRTGWPIIRPQQHSSADRARNMELTVIDKRITLQSFLLRQKKKLTYIYTYL